MEPTDLTIEILKDIRTEVRSTREELSLRIDRTNERLDRTNERLDLVTDGQVHLATEVVAVASAVHALSDLLREDRALRSKVEDHDHRIASLERRVG